MLIMGKQGAEVSKRPKLSPRLTFATSPSEVIDRVSALRPRQARGGL